MTYEQLWHRLTGVYEGGEAKAIVRLVLEERFGMSMTDIVCGKVTQLSADDQAELEKIARRLEKAEPVQYVLGEAEFCGRRFHVEPGVLIPRPETAALCRWIVSETPVRPGATPAMLDIGTGSGCIACTLALDIPGSKVTAWDISDEALRIARHNAQSLCAAVDFRREDAFRPSPSAAHALWNLIVSNPPYVCEKEKAAMERNVLDYEPPTALFVPDDDPLCFYRAIAQYASVSLRTSGGLFFEINPVYYDDIRDLVQSAGLRLLAPREDSLYKHRFVAARKP